MNKDELGRWGEDLAADHLQARGLVVMARNWRCSEGEIDIVATDGIGRLIICEVKTRSGVGFGLPAEAVDARKRQKLRRLAQLYATATCRGWVSFRFDVVSVIRQPGHRPELTHLVEAF